MTTDLRGVTSEMRVSPRVVLGGLVVLQAVIYLAVELLPYSRCAVNTAVTRFFILFVACGVGWYLLDRRDAVGRWFTVFATVVGMAFAGLSLESPAALSWAALTPIITLAMIGLPAALLAAALESVVVLAMSCSLLGDAVAGGVAVVSVWAVLATVYVVTRPFEMRTRWLSEYFDRARLQLEEARDRRAEYEQALADLTHANRQMVLMNQRVAGLRQVAEEAQKSKTRFVARVSHEFRTPLNMIIGLVDLMVTSPQIYDVSLSPRMREALQVVHRNCEHLSDMVNDVLDLTRIETDRMVLHKERVDLAVVIDSATEAVSPLLESKGLSLETTVPQDLPEIYCDRTRIEQVVLNLLSNAARYTERGGITISVTSAEQRRVTVSVQDTGSGIRSEDVDRIFEPFCQGTSELWRDRGGSGLGLSISRQFVELHGGTMRVESVLGAGTTFVFDLPVSPDLGPVARPGHQIREDWVWRERQTRPNFPESHYIPRFIVCDETGDLQPFLGSWQDRVEFVPVQGVERTLQALREAPAQAVLLNGRDLEQVWSQVEIVRQAAEGTPVIGCSVVCNLDRARSLGIRDHLVKPVRRADLISALQSAGPGVSRVLVVDDDPDAVQLFADMLQTYDANLVIDKATDGHHALAQLRDDPPDMLLLDLVMPEVDGWQVLEAMAHDDTVPRVPTFLISAQDPRDQPATSGFLMASVSEGISPTKVIRSSLQLAEVLLEPAGPGPGGSLDPAPR